VIYSAPALGRAGHLTITPWSYQSIGTELILAGQGSQGAAAWPSGGLVIFVPFWVPESMTVTQMFWSKGAIAGNGDMGIYNESQVLLVSAGTTAVAASANISQVINITDTTLARGRYYMAICMDTVTTLTMLRAAPEVGICQGLGLLQQAGVTLPLSTGASPATFAKAANAYIPHFGLQGYRTFGP
jgi:hypothetical protein